MDRNSPASERLGQGQGVAPLPDARERDAGSNGTPRATSSSSSSSAPGSSSGHGQGRRPSGREVYKNGWLKYMANPGKSGSLVNLALKADKYWAIFCVVNEKEPFLELYLDKQLRGQNRCTPVISYPMKGCLHVSPSIVITEKKDCYEFVITLENQVVRLVATSRELMDDWIDTIRTKLRQLNILQPKDNCYSKQPVHPAFTRQRQSSLHSVRPLPPIPANEAPADGSNRNATPVEPESHYASLPEPATPQSSHGLPSRSSRLSNFTIHSQDSLYEPIFGLSSGTDTSLGHDHYIIRHPPAPEEGPPPYDSYERNDHMSSSAMTPGQEEGSHNLLSLRESQVMRLQKEISHLDGIRVVVRRKDCVDAIALVDCSGGVYVSGWKQKSHPQLHNTFHIGDRLVSVSGVGVSSATEAYRVMKEMPLVVEFILRRVPHGKVLVIKRDFEGQDLGIQREGNSAEIVSVSEDGLAARFGLTPKTTPVDASRGSECNWVLTEINNRPLNLFFKGNELKSRLNAVGKDISLLVQPSDLVKALKKQLKAFKSYKDYILQ